MSDPWAEAQAAQNAARNTANKPAGNAGRAAAPVQDMANPFRTTQEVAPAGGQFDPFVPHTQLLGRMIVMVPKSFTDQDPKKEEYGGGVQDRWTVDIVVLDGGPLTFDYTTKETKDGPEVKKTMNVTEFPATFRGQWERHPQLVGALNGADKEGAFIYGVYSMVPTAADARGGLTIEKLAENTEQWYADIAARKPGTPASAPRHTFNLDSRPHIMTQERINLALAWWEQEKANRLSTAS